MMHQTNGNEGNGRNEIYYIYFCRRLSQNDRAPRYGLLIDEKEKERVIDDVLKKKYSHKRVIHMGVASGYLQFLIDGVSVTIPRESKEQRDYVVITLSSEEILPMMELVERLGSPLRECVLMLGEKNLFKVMGVEKPRG